MSGGIFVVQPTGALVEMAPEPYDAEAVLQKLLADYPGLLGGSSTEGEARRWLLVRREVGVPDGDSGAARWSVDHVFLDHEGVPTIVEVKRSSDSGIRRAVVGQMLDYAANISAYLPADAMRRTFVERCEKAGLDPEQEITALLGP